VETARTGRADWAHRNSRVPHLGHNHWIFANKPRYGSTSGICGRTSDVHGLTCLLNALSLVASIATYRPFFLVLAGVALLYGSAGSLGLRGLVDPVRALLMARGALLLPNGSSPYRSRQTVPNGLSPGPKAAHGASRTFTNGGRRIRTQMSPAFDEADQTTRNGLISPAPGRSRCRNVRTRLYDLVIVGTGTAADGGRDPVARGRLDRSDHRFPTIRRHLCAAGLRSEEDADRKRRDGGQRGAHAGRGVAGDVKIDWPELIAFKRTFTDPIPQKREHD